MAISGKTGIVDGACSDIVSWTVDIETDLLEKTSFCSGGFKEYIDGLKGATGSLTSYVRYTGSSTIELSNSESGTVTIAGNVLWNTESIENSVEGLQSFTQGFTFTGAFTVS